MSAPIAAKAVGPLATQLLTGTGVNASGATGALAVNIASKLIDTPRMMVLGDSQDADAKDTTAPLYYWNTWGWFCWLRWLCGHRFITHPTYVFAVSGAQSGVLDPSKDLLAYQVPAAIALANSTPGRWFATLKIGTNDLPTVPLDTIKANIDNALTQLNAAGIAVILHPVWPRGSGSMFNTNVRKSHGDLVKWMADRARKSGGKVVFANTLPDMMDYSTGAAVTGLLVDDVHTNNYGSFVAAKALVAAVNGLLPPAAHAHLGILTDAYDATYAPGGNLIANGFLTNTTGALANGVTGTAPAGWTATKTSTSTISAAGSNAAHSTLFGLTDYVLTLGGTGDGAQILLQQTITTGFAVGDLIQGSAFVRFDAGPQGIAGVGISITALNGGTTLFSAKDGNTQSTKGVMYPYVGEIPLLTPSFTIPAGTTSLRVTISILGVTGQAINAVPKFSRVDTHKVTGF